MASREKTIQATAAGYDARLRIVQDRIDTYHPHCQRRYTNDARRDTARCLDSVGAWLAGDNDRSYADPHPSFGKTLEDFRAHYAEDSLRDALHYLVWAEYYVGLRDRDSAVAADPFSQPRKAAGRRS
jgi:hypothetical protein